MDQNSNFKSSMKCLRQYFKFALSHELSLLTFAENDKFQQFQFEVRISLDYSLLHSYLSYLFKLNVQEKLCNVTSMEVDQFCDYYGKPDNCSKDGIDVRNLFYANIGNQTIIYINQSQSFLSLDSFIFRYRYAEDGDGSNFTTQLFLCSQDNDFSLSCPFILDDLKNYIILNNTLKHIESESIYGSDNYELIDNKTVKICSTFSQSGTVATVNYFVKYDAVQTILSYVGCILSLVSLALTLLVYCLLPSLRTLPGKAVMSVTISLFCAQFLLNFGAGQTNITELCKVIAIAMHFFWLASFFWMSVLAYDVSKTFNKKTYDRSKGKRWKTFVKYSIVAWGLPFVIVAVCVTLSMRVTSLHFEYGSTSICWISDAIISLIIFGGPVILILLVNIVFFGLTVHGVRDTMKTASIIQGSKSSSSKMSELKIYFKYSKELKVLGESDGLPGLSSDARMNVNGESQKEATEIKIEVRMPNRRL
ncbi:adhesion G protein-coupled receptor E4-like [Anneissia japonica]|uniref:adhesion G protein-coupled receptor E4-like n=1 Tax=Anneissia japonica TaxID=1529436 RepID=UPI0014257FA8|nr:adhesion G protein-coupled receptor E4-like [Anneissia japonica]